MKVDESSSRRLAQPTSVDSKLRLAKLLRTLDTDLVASLSQTVAPAAPSNCILLMHAHCLPSFSVLVDALVNYAGFPARNIIVVPKPYSTIPGVLDDLSSTGIRVVDTETSFRIGRYDDSQYHALISACDLAASLVGKRPAHTRRRQRVIVVDDGGLLSTVWGHIRDTWDIPTISIQHTASGIGREPRNVPKIDVARSAVKRQFEAKIIAKSIVRKIKSMQLDFEGRTVGIAGLGAIGGSLASAFGELNVRTIGLEKRPIDRIGAIDKVYSKPRDFILDSDYIFGCTGKNWTSGITRKRVIAGKVFISCSSRDVEFKNLLNLFSDEDVSHNFADVSLDSDPQAIVRNAGFPINFDRKHEWEEFHEIAITRLLILYGIVLARFIRTTDIYDDTIMLPPAIQRLIIEDWLESTGESLAAFGHTRESISTLRFWREHSVGIDVHK